MRGRVSVSRDDGACDTCRGDRTPPLEHQPYSKIQSARYRAVASTPSRGGLGRSRGLFSTTLHSSGDATPCEVTPVILHGVVGSDTNQCRMTGVTLHGVVSPELSGGRDITHSVTTPRSQSGVCQKTFLTALFVPTSLYRGAGKRLPHNIAGQTSPSIHPPIGNSYAPRDFIP